MAVVFLHIESENFVVMEIFLVVEKNYIECSVLQFTVAYCRLSYLVSAFYSFRWLSTFSPFLFACKKTH